MPVKLKSRQGVGNLTARQAETIVTRIQAFALYVHPHKGMHWIFEHYGLDWTEELNPENGVSFEQWMSLWGLLVDTEYQRLVDCTSAMGG